MLGQHTRTYTLIREEAALIREEAALIREEELKAALIREEALRLLSTT